MLHTLTLTVLQEGTLRCSHLSSHSQHSLYNQGDRYYRPFNNPPPSQGKVRVETCQPRRMAAQTINLYMHACAQAENLQQWSMLPPLRFSATFQAPGDCQWFMPFIFPDTLVIKRLSSVFKTSSIGADKGAMQPF